MQTGLITLGDVVDVETFDLLQELNELRQDIGDPSEFDLARYNEIMDQLWGEE